MCILYIKFTATAIKYYNNLTDIVTYIYEYCFIFLYAPIDIKIFAKKSDIKNK